MSKGAALLADIMAIALFALLARVAHQSEDMPLSFTGWLSTLWPFALGVLLAWVVLAALKREGIASYPDGLIVWVITVVTGLVIWAIRNSAMPHWSFILVASVTSAILMFGWRLVAARRKSTQTPA